MSVNVSLCALIFLTLQVYILQSFLVTAAAKSLQSCLTLCDPIDGSPPGSPVPGILQARTLEWVAISFSNANCIITAILANEAGGYRYVRQGWVS